MSVGTLTDSNNYQHAFEIFRTQEGRVSDREVDVEEELIAAGVDGRRWRTVSARYPIFTATTITTCANFAAAIEKARAFESTVGTNCKLAVSLAGTTYNYNSIHVVECKPVASPGYLSGSGISATNSAYVTAQWTLAVVEQASTTP